MPPDRYSATRRDITCLASADHGISWPPERHPTAAGQRPRSAPTWPALTSQAGPSCRDRSQMRAGMAVTIIDESPRARRRIATVNALSTGTTRGIESDYAVNPAPRWPKPPENWVPPAGWKPDPSWPPAPPGWQFWVETSGRNTEGLAQRLGLSSSSTRPFRARAGPQPCPTRLARGLGHRRGGGLARRHLAAAD